MNSYKGLAILATVLWVIIAVAVGLLWMNREIGYILSDHGDGTVTFQDGSDSVSTSKEAFYRTAIRNTAIVVLFFPTLPYLLFMFSLLLVWFIARHLESRSRSRVAVATEHLTLEERWEKLRRAAGESTPEKE